MQHTFRFFLTALLFAAPSVTSFATGLRVVAYEGGPAPNVVNGVYGSLGVPSLNIAGQVAFSASLVGRGSSLWSEGSGSLRMVMETGQSAPGLAGESFYRLISPPTLNDSGKIAFAAEYGTNNQGIWVEREGGSLELMAVRGGIAPGTGGITYTYPFPPLFNNAGRIQFYSQLGGSLSGIWTDSSGTLTALVVEEQQPPNMPAGAKYEVMGRHTFNNAGQSAFSAYMLVGSGGVTTDNRVGIWSNRGGPPSLLYRTGSQAPGTAAGAIFSSFDNLKMNDAGQIAFGGSLKIGVGGVSGSNFIGIWSEGSGSLELVARRGFQAPGTPAAANFSGFDDPELNNSGKVVFTATLVTGAGSVTSSNDSGIWTDSSGALSLIAREGSPAPGGAGAVFGHFAPSQLEYAINATGRVAFTGSISGAGVTSDKDWCLWAQDSAGVLQLVAREGDQLELAPGDVRTISDLEFGGQLHFGAASGSGLNDNGLAFRATFLDGTDAIFVANLVTEFLPGDLNHDSTVDAADYVVWRKNPAAFGEAQGYADWRANFGKTTGSSAALATVPEPSTTFLVVMTIVINSIRRRKP